MKPDSKPFQGALTQYVLLQHQYVIILTPKAWFTCSLRGLCNCGQPKSAFECLTGDCFSVIQCRITGLTFLPQLLSISSTVIVCCSPSGWRLCTLWAGRLHVEPLLALAHLRLRLLGQSIGNSCNCTTYSCICSCAIQHTQCTLVHLRNGADKGA